LSPPTNPHGLRWRTRDTKIQKHLCLVLDEASMPPPNHSSEQAIRMRTVVRTVPNGWRSDWGRDLLAAGRSVVNPGKRHGLAAYQAIQKARAPRGPLFEPG
jgi:hypothetical protein